MKIYSVPKYGDLNSDVGILQKALFAAGYDPGPIDNDFRGRTSDALKAFQKSKGMLGTGVIPGNGGNTFKYLGLELVATEAVKGHPQWLAEIKKYEGLSETDPKLVAALEPMWKKAGLPGYKGLSGSARAWCAITIMFALSAAGVQFLAKGGAGAANQGRAYQEVNWKKNGLPKQAIIHLNSSKCGSGSGNHVTVMDGECAASDIVDSSGKVKAGATFPGFGGNQGNKMKLSWYKVSTICNVRWPEKEADGTPIALPPPVNKSNGCNGKKASDESTR